MAGLESAPPPKMKRPSPSDDQEQRPSKRQKRRLIHHHLRHEPSAFSGAPLDDGNAQFLFTRSIEHILGTVGFEGADPTAIESFRANAEEYLIHLTSSVTRSMLSSRRTQPLPQDFNHALKNEALTCSSLLPYLQMKPQPSANSPLLEALPFQDASNIPPDALPGVNLKITKHEEARSFVPRHLPPFPGEHTYKATPGFTDRERDPRRIRERATEEGRLGEEALRRLVAAGGGVGRKGVAKGRESEGRRRKEANAWQSTMDALTIARPDSPVSFEMGHEVGVPSLTVDGSSDDSRAHRKAIQSAVNSEKPYWRRNALPANNTKAQGREGLSTHAENVSAR
ncbi:MAG: cross-pathway control WD-repeat protein cpc2 [Chaenotheca gracillima]|nr:MAG: cross-pathway control WD-repeat protein cpc2 [Chaenotheca gracillima]